MKMYAHSLFGHACTCHFSEDNKVMFWDIRSAKGSLMVLDQHNGDTTGSPQSGEHV